ncbi:Dehydrogenase [Lachnellula occidentalis]|uniref:Dehydrogenase n=1 Tax=Lachnellula occidentalis TaxID=215460 RepID=A0A8H8UHM1_9HELO|nr:Dehydrogenase [Lachnellula occidentalis]
MVSRTICNALLATTFVGLKAVSAVPLGVDVDLDLGLLDIDIAINVATIGTPDKEAEYDYVVVGGGTGGLAVAARLSEKFNVAVIEAGSYYETVNNQSTVPEYFEKFISMKLDKSTWAPTDWGFTTTNQTALGGQEYHYSRAKTLGGCSAYNAMLYQRGTAGTYDEWADMLDDEDYKWDKFEPYFAKSVNYSVSAERFANSSIPAQEEGAFTATGGPLHVAYPEYATPFGSWTKLAMAEVGLEEQPGFGGGVLNGSQFCPQTANPYTGERDSSQTSFLNAAVAAGQSITVYNGTMAQKINFNSGKKAVSVTVSTSGGASYKISAKHEIVVSAGAFQSPQLLMVSGVGPAATLKEFDIPVISDLAGVGQNMWDHIFYGMVWPVAMETRQRLLEPAYLEEKVAEYHVSPTNILSSNVFDFLAWEKLQNRTQLSASSLAELAKFPADWPELEYISGSLDNSALPSTYRDYTTMIPALVAPTSRGNISISSASMDDQPLINPNWFGTQTDRELAVASLKRVREFMATDAVQGALLGEEIAPGVAVQSDEDILAYIEGSFSTVFHAACTCAMGLKTDPMAVLDSKARVYGVTGLRVVDSSAFPTLPPGHPMSTIYALAEKIADDIKNGC